jgi:phage head maturation protease
MPERKGIVSIEWKAAPEQEGEFRAIFSRFNMLDRDEEVTLPDAFERGQAVRIAQWGHNWNGFVIGRGAIDFDGEKAWVDGRFYLDIPIARDTYLSVKESGDLQEWSYGFEVKDWSVGEFGDPPRQVRFLRRLNVFEVSPVMLGAGIGTMTEAIKGAGERLQEVEARLRADATTIERRYGELAALEAKQGRALSQARIDRIAADTEALGALIASLIATRDDLRALLAEAAPADNGKALDARALLIETEMILARLNGVPL